jgi:hypothetical protein
MFAYKILANKGTEKYLPGRLRAKMELYYSIVF